ncbi:Iron-sulfur cluster-binding domain-containing protein [Maridesulfovibrio ferrireducens]|uniref:Iron-sulfur cluster-binding domain-containing protein n=1 Tax=Maridesulfovibrio ferrireducens TaxID=246191 RepID=A0A1G9B6U7_9BACT|nr:radical SAM/SPASM domain-containing protein [Maridesulfovibrio ferrireducens]SDK35251.1 Iron-sulfur cluster-binding domain-containing protein [Maridesulfovibrio ferrireducens]
MKNTEILDKASILLTEKKFLDAEILAKRVLKSDTNNTSALKILTNIALQCGAPSLATCFFEKYSALAEPDLDFSNNLAETYAILGQHEKAKKMFYKAFSSTPENETIRKQYFQHGYNSADFDIFPYEDFRLNPDEPLNKPDKIYFHAIIVVWGEEFTSCFMNSILPTQLGAGNIDALNTDSRSLYIIYTTPKDAKYIKSSPTFTKLKETIDVRIYSIDLCYTDKKNKHEMMILCHKHSVRKAHLAGARLVFLAPDAVFSGSTFKKIYQKASEGYNAVMIGTMRVSKEDFLPALNNIFLSDDKLEVSIKERDLVEMALDRWHPDTKSCFIDAEKFSGWPSQLFWEVPGEGVVAHNFHLHPLMVYPIKLQAFKGTVDDDCVQKICGDFNDIYIVQDSDEMVGFDLSKCETRIIQTDAKVEMSSLLGWIKDYTDEFHRKYVTHEIYFHCNQISEKWNEISRKAEATISSLLAYPENEKSHCFSEILTDHDLKYPAPVLDTVCFQLTSKGTKDMDELMVRQIVDYIKNTGVKHSTLGFYGEMLNRKGWTKYAQELLDQGVKLHICSNFNMKLTDEEHLILSQFDHIQLSIDTADEKTLKEIRPPASLKTMLLNMHKISAAALKNGRKQPIIQWCCTLVDEVVSQLGDLVNMANSNNVTEIQLNELGYFDEHNLPVNSIFALKDDHFLKAVEQVNAARKLAEENNISLNLIANWDQMVESKIAIEQAKSEFDVDIDIAVKPVELGSPMQNIQGVGRFYEQKATIPGLGETRECMYPWNSAYIMPDGDLYSCCIRGKSMGKIGPDNSISEVMHNAEYYDLRKQLITGNITDPVCLRCPATAVVPVRRLKYLVANLIRRSKKSQRAHK